MNEGYVDCDPVESKDFDWLQAMQPIVWQVASDGKVLDKTLLVEAFCDETGIAPQRVRAFVEGMDSLSAYMTMSLDEGDALDEEGEAVAASRRAVRPMLEARLQGRMDGVEAALQSHRARGQERRALYRRRLCP